MLTTDVDEPSFPIVRLAEVARTPAQKEKSRRETRSCVLGSTLDRISERFARLEMHKKLQKQPERERSTHCQTNTKQLGCMIKMAKNGEESLKTLQKE